MDNFVNVADLILRYMVLPILGLVGWLMKKIMDMDRNRQEMTTDIRVLEAKMEAHAEASKTSYKTLKETMDKAIAKLDGIEQYLRDKK